MAYSSVDLQARRDRDKVNAAMRASDVWRNAIKGMGLNPDGPLKLSKGQQQQLAQTLGVPTSDFHIDQAGNINDYHGWKGLPTAAKIGVIAAAALGTAGAAGAFGGTTALTAEQASAMAAANVVPAAAGVAPTVAAATPTLAGTLLKYGLQYGLPVAGGLISSKVAANANADAARLESEFNNRALDEAIKDREYERRQGEDERAYQRRIDEYERNKYAEGTGYDRSKYAEGEGYNRAKYVEGEGYDRAKYNEATNYGRRNYGNFVETLEPYRATGVGANQYAARLMGQNPAPYTGGTYYDLAREARTPVNLPTNVNLPTSVNLPSGGPNLNFPTGESGPTGSGQSAGSVSTTMPVGGKPQLVTMEAPDGTVKQVPSDQVSHFVSLGAKVVS